MINVIYTGEVKNYLKIKIMNYGPEEQSIWYTHTSIASQVRMGI